MNQFVGIEAKKWVPLPYQKKGVKWLTSRPAAALFWRPGLRKTSTVYAAFLDLRKRNLAKRMLVLAPLKVCQGVWRQEAEKWQQFTGLKVGFAHGKFKEEILQDESMDVVLLNYDGILWACSDRKHPKIEGFDIVVYDESTRMKSHATRRFKEWRYQLHRFKFRWALTGTPAPNGLMDLFGQVYCLDGGERLGTGISKFRWKYFHQKPFDKWGWYPNPDTQKHITRQLKDIANYIDEKDWNDMPKLLPSVREVILEPEAKRQYRELEKQFILKLEAGVVTAANAAVLSGKLRQAASGQVYDETRKVIHIHREKLENLESLIEELAGDPVIICVAFLHEVDAIRSVLGPVPYLGGGMSDTASVKIMRDWNLGWTPVLLAHPASVSRGLNLQGGGHNICWFTLTWDGEDYDQMIRRLYRTGQTDTVMNYVISAKGTIDEYVASRLVEKADVQESFLSGLKRHYKVA